MKKFEVKNTQTKVVYLDKYYILRGIKATNNTKEVVAEKDFSWLPDEQEISQFLYDNQKATFCVVEEAYRLVERTIMVGA